MIMNRTDLEPKPEQKCLLLINQEMEYQCLVNLIRGKKTGSKIDGWNILE